MKKIDNIVKTLFCIGLVKLCGLCIVAFFAIDALAEDDCKCPQLKCNASCEDEVDLTFYSEKCGPGGARVKSCSRPKCVIRADAPKVCQNSTKEEEKQTKETTKIVPDREIASVVAVSPIVGHISILEGSAQVIRNQQALAAAESFEVREKDKLITDEKSRLQVKFLSGNFLNVTEKSEIILTEIQDKDDEKNKKKVLLELLKGKIRNQVNEKYTGSQSYYRVKAGGAVAGVRGTDFVVSIDINEKEVISKVETVSGDVDLSDLKFEKKVPVTKSEGATYVVGKEELYSFQEKHDVKLKGYLTPVYKLTEGELALLSKSTQFARLDSTSGGAEKAVSGFKSKPGGECMDPVASVNQCAWICENNPQGENRCRTDLTNVTCVRRICNANGKWSSPTRLPASYHEACSGRGAVVKPCDY